MRRILDTGVVTGRTEIDHFCREITRRRPCDDELPSLYRTGTYFFDGRTLIWEYPRNTPGGDLVEVIELDGARIRRHRIYRGWRGTEHILADAVTKAATRSEARSEHARSEQ